MNFVLNSQSLHKEKIDSLINELTPTHTIKKSYKNLSLIGFDVLDEKMKRITSSKFRFHPGDQFYIVLYGKRKMTEGKAPGENKIESCNAVFKYHNGGYFWNTKTFYLLGEKEIEGFMGEWQIGGIYKIRFPFKVPEFTLPGEYTLIMRSEKFKHPSIGRLITFNEIQIDIKKSEIQKSEKNYD